MSTEVSEQLPIIDLDELILRMMGSVDMADRMLDKFLRAAPEEYDLLETLIRSGDSESTASLAHRHKGTTRTMSAPRLASAAAMLESRAQSGSTTELLGLLDDLRDAYAELRDAVESSERAKLKTLKTGSAK